MDDIAKTNKITNLYAKLTYIDDYSSSVILFSFITIIILLICVYCFVMIRSQSIKRDWVNQRCKPGVIPFAGFINKPDNMSATEYTSENFRYCTQTILKKTSEIAVSPYTEIVSTLTNLSGEFTESMNIVRQMSSNIRNKMGGNTNVVYEKIQSAITPLQPLFESVKNIFAKVTAVMTTFFYAISGLNLTLKSLIGSIAELCVISLVSLASIVAALWVTAAFVWPVAVPAGIATVTYAVLAAMLVPLLIFMKSASKVKPKACFDKNTEIVMEDGTTKKIIDIQVGDVLLSKSIVTAKLKLSATSSTMYNLNGVIVSNSHTVKHNDKWILVSEHPDAIKIENYLEPYIYCLNTSDKQIIINEICFADWDEIYKEEHIDNLRENAGLLHHCTFKTPPEVGVLSDNGNSYHALAEGCLRLKKCEGVSSGDIHTSMDGGFSGNTLVQMKDGTTKEIQNIKIGDILQKGEEVYGVVEINGQDLPQYNYKIGNNGPIVGGPNLTVCDPKLAFESTMYLNKFMKVTKMTRENKLYHLLTDKQKFSCCGVCFYDYNASIDLFLDKTRENLLSMKYV